MWMLLIQIKAFLRGYVFGGLVYCLYYDVFMKNGIIRLCRGPKDKVIELISIVVPGVLNVCNISFKKEKDVPCLT